MDDVEQQRSKKWLWIGIGILILILIIIGLFFFFGKNTKGGAQSGGVLPFGTASDVGSRPAINADGNTIGSGGNTDATAPEPLFRKLSDKPVAGEYALSKDAEQYVRYVEKETGHIYEVHVKDGSTTELSNTTIPRIYEAYWGLGGNIVVLRYLEENPYDSSQDVVKTSLGYLVGPTGSSSNSVGHLSIDFLLDNITAVSVAPNGKNLFYLVKTSDGVSGSIVDLSTKIVKEVFRNSFSEWLPELLDNGQVILTTKASSDVKGYAYLYTPGAKTLERIVREKDGVTTHTNPLGTRVLYAENITTNMIFGVYNPKGFVLDEGFITHEQPLQITTLPEKCAWRKDGIRIFCGAFNATQKTAPIPDAWYQGTLSFNDSFWGVNVDTNEVKFLADPETAIKTDFDVIFPTITPDEGYFVFINKKDGILWSLRIPEDKQSATASTSDLTPNELKDAQGSTATQTPQNQSN